VKDWLIIVQDNTVHACVLVSFLVDLLSSKLHQRSYVPCGTFWKS